MRPFWSHASCFMSYPVRCPRTRINHNMIVETMDDYVESLFIRSLVNFEPHLRCDSLFLCLCRRLGRSVSAKLSPNSQWTNTSSSRFKTQRDTAICNQASQMNQSLNASKAMNLRGCVLGSVAEFLVVGDIAFLGFWPISEHYQMPNEKPEQILGSLPASCPSGKMKTCMDSY